MQMLLNNGTVINDAPIMSEKTREYLNRFWKFPSKKETDKEKDKYYTIDYKRIWQSKVEYQEHNISNVI